MDKIIKITLLVLGALVLAVLSFQHPERFLAAYVAAVLGYLISVYLFFRRYGRRR